MSDTTDDAFTPEQLTELVLMQAENSAQTAKDLGAVAHQSLAALVVNALLLHELERVGLVDHDAVLAEAVQRAKSIHPPGMGASVAQVIKTVFDGGHRAPWALPASAEVARTQNTDSAARERLAFGVAGLIIRRDAISLNVARDSSGPGVKGQRR